MARRSRIVSVASAFPPHRYDQPALQALAQDRVLGPEWEREAESAAFGRQIERLFTASRVATRYSGLDMHAYFSRPRSTGERMAAYQPMAMALGREALERALRPPADGDGARQSVASQISDFIVVSCTGYGAPGLETRLASELGMPRDVRRLAIGHMGCYGALVGLRQALAAVRAYPGATVALLSVELTTLHFMPTRDLEALTSFALFGDAASALLLTTLDDELDDEAEHSAGDAPWQMRGPELVDVYCAADFNAIEQMSWQITDTGFLMELSPRVPVTLRRNVVAVVERLLAPHGLAASDVRHWLIHPGGPSILDAVQGKLELRDEQLAPAWAALRDYGNCSSATVLVMLDELLRSGAPQPGEWGVMMAFGPGLTLETCLLRF